MGVLVCPRLRWPHQVVDGRCADAVNHGRGELDHEDDDEEGRHGRVVSC